MRLFRALVPAALLLGGALPASGYTQGWAEFVNLSPSSTLVTNTLCYTDGQFLRCDGTGPAALQGDRITSGTSAVTVNSATGVVSLSTGGVTWGYVGSSQSYLPNVSATAIEANVVLNMPVVTVSNITGPTGGSPVVPGAGGTGYFVMTNGTTNGNIGGLSGANTFCRNDLSSNNWMGKPAVLDTSKIFAWLCDGTACKNGLASTTYYYANAGDVTKGGAYFVTDSVGRGPNDSNQWDASNRFGVAASYWTNAGGNSTSWGGLAGDSRNNCNSFTSSAPAALGIYGTSSNAGSQRWAAQYSSCSTLFRLICFVNP